MNTSVKLTWNRRKKLLKNKTAQVFIQVYFYNSKKQKFIPTKVFLSENQWQGEIVNHKDANKLNAILNQQIEKIRQWDLKLWARGERLTPDRLDLFLSGHIEESFLDFWDKFVESRPLADNSVKNYNTARMHISEFGIKFISDLTPQNIGKFDVYLRSKGLKSSTIHSIHRRVKSVIIGAMISDRLIKNPYDGMRTQRPKEMDIKYLTEDELNKIETVNLPLERLSKIRDVFVFCCYTGLNFIDVSNLQKDSIIKDGEDLWIRNPRQKTDVESVILLLPKAVKILEKYDKLPVLSNVRTNAYLKEIATLAGINKNLTFHMARHTCGTLLLKHGVPIEVISRILGHSSIRTTQIYARVLSSSVGEHLRRLKDVL